MKRIGILIGMAMFAVGIAVAGAAGSVQAQSTPESEDPIILAINEWTGQHITTHIAANILRRMGYNVELVTASYYPQFAAIQEGDITVSLEIWEGTTGELFDETVASGNAIDLGDTGIVEKQTWWYPTYVEEECPGLPDWKALNECAEMFSNAETYPKGRLVDWPLEWGGNNDKRIEALGLDFVSVPAGSEGAIIAEIRSANLRKEPVLAMLWAPHWIHDEVEGEWVQLPEFEEICTEDPSWGLNSDATWDCGWPSGWIKKIAWAGLKEKWPGAHEFLSNYQITNEVQTPLIRAVDNDGKDVEVVTDSWVEANEAVWKPWTE